MLSDANILCTFTIIIKNWFYFHIFVSSATVKKKTFAFVQHVQALSFWIKWKTFACCFLVSIFFHTYFSSILGINFFIYKHSSYLIVNILFLICFLNLHTAFFSWIRKKVKDDNQSLFIFRFLVVCQSFVECGSVSKSYSYSAREDHLFKV